MQKSIIAFGSLVILLSCSKLVTIDIPDIESELNANAILVAGSPVTLYLSQSKSLNDTSAIMVSAAHTELYQDEHFAEALQETEKGIYYGSTEVHENHTYRILIRADGFPLLQSGDSLVSAPDIKDYQRLTIAGYTNDGMYYSAARFSITDPPDTRDYYEVALYRISSTGKSRALDLFPTDDPVILNEGLPMSVGPGFPFSDEIFDGETQNITMNYGLSWTTTMGDSVIIEEYDPYYRLVVEIRKTSRDYYLFRRSLILQVNGKFPDFWNGLGNPSALYSNVDNGLGIFAGYSFVRDTLDRP